MVDNSSGSCRGVGARVPVCGGKEHIKHCSECFCAPSLVDVLETVLLCGSGNQQLLQGQEGGKGIRLKQVIWIET